MSRPSKTAQKRDADRALLLGKHLVDVPQEAIAGFGLPQDVLDALAQARMHQGHKEFRRLMQHVGALLRDVDVTAVEQHHRTWQETQAKEPARLEQVKRWRDALVDGDDRVLEDVLAAVPLLTRGQVQKLVDGARWERKHQKPPRDFRLLFALIRDAMR